MLKKKPVNIENPKQGPSLKKKDTIIQSKGPAGNKLHVPGLNSSIPYDILFLQGVIGNQAVNELMGKSNSQQTIQQKENSTGLPDTLKDGIESLSGLSMDDVRVHHNSPKPDTLHALAYTRGRDIYVGPGQEKHLAHEAWHVVQQKQGRVFPTGNVNGLSMNDSRTLEKEADVMGQKALQMKPPVKSVKEKNRKQGDHTITEKNTIQGVFTYKGIRYDQENADTFKKTFYEVSTNDIKDLARSDTDFGTLKTREDFVDAIDAMKKVSPSSTPAMTVENYTFSDKTIVLIRDIEHNLVIGIDSHQNKHQHPDALIPELGNWKSKKGSLFASHKGLDWHRDNTAVTMRDWARKKLEKDMNVKIFTDKKKPFSDGYIYDAALFMDQGVAVVTYHCNPPENEK